MFGIFKKQAKEDQEPVTIRELRIEQPPLKRILDTIMHTYRGCSDEIIIPRADPGHDADRLIAIRAWVDSMMCVYENDARSQADAMARMLSVPASMVGKVGGGGFTLQEGPEPIAPSGMYAQPVMFEDIIAQDVAHDAAATQPEPSEMVYPHDHWSGAVNIGTSKPHP